MHLTIVRGSHQIGGSCVEISTDTTTILIDIGLPLNPNEKPIDIKDKKIDAVLISHSHLDHYGQLNIISKNIPVYMGKLSRLLIEGLAFFTGGKTIRNPVKNFTNKAFFHIGNIKITPYLIDHSATDSYSFLIEADNKKIFYTGDFRATGYKGFLIEKVAKEVSVKDIDVMLMEGTCVNRLNEDYPDERSVLKKIKEVIEHQNNSSFLLSSSANTDRLVSATLACDNAGKVFVIDIYTAWLLEEIKSFTKSIPLLDRAHVRVLSKGKYAASQYRKIKGNKLFDAFIKKIYSKSNVIEMSEIKENPEKYLIKVTARYIKSISEELATKDNPVNIIYSMWRGYNTYNEMMNIDNARLIYVHTSGHADVNILQNFAKNINPKKLLPIHTEDPEKFISLFDNVKLLEDNVEYNV